jgi:DNA topoisomerase VI subunit A/intein/homing endonuclease
VSLPQDKVDLEARLRAARVIHEKFKRVLEDILRGKPPKLVIPKRTLANTIFDPKRGILLLGSETLEREFLDMGEARRFMQTLLMASIIYQALVENEYPTIRDLYYRGKHTILYRDLRGRLREENTWDEQAESDAVIRDVEVFTGLLREDMLILSKEKGKVVGNMRIRSGGDVIDLSKLGHGAYAIESTPDLIEFLDWDAEFVLVVEKDAVFQQLHRIGFWKRYKAILVTGAGQPDRATRRFVRRLNEELGLPVYILTDSIPEDETVILRGPEGWVNVGRAGELLSSYFEGGEREWAPIDAEVPAWDPMSGAVTWSKVGYAYRHYVDDEVVEIETRGRGVVRVTGGHSLFVVRDGRVTLTHARDVRPGDYLVVAETIPSPPLLVEDGRPSCSDVRERLAKVRRGIIRLSDGNAWLLGITAATSRLSEGRFIVLRLKGSKRRLAWKILDMLSSCGVRAYLDEEEGHTDVVVDAEECLAVAEALGMESRGARRIPTAVFTAPLPVRLAFIRGLIEAAGRLERGGSISIKLHNEDIAKQVFNLLLMSGINPSVARAPGEYVIRIARHSARTPPDAYRALTGMEPYGEAQGPDTTYSIPITAEIRRLLLRLHGEGSIYINPTARRVAKWKLLKAFRALGRLEGLEPLIAGNATVVEVIRVSRRPYRGYVYDLAVPGANTFIGSYGVIYHNSDPYGWYIYSVFKVGSIQLSYESERLATPKARFLGVSMTDVFGYDSKKPYLTEAERRNFIIKAKEADIKRAKELLNYKWFQTPGWRREIRIFLDKKAKLEIEALASKGLKFLAFKYIPEKIETGDWIE